MTTENEWANECVCVCVRNENLCCPIVCIFSCKISVMFACLYFILVYKDVNNKFEFYGLWTALLVNEVIWKKKNYVSWANLNKVSIDVCKYVLFTFHYYAYMILYFDFAVEGKRKLKW